MTATVVQAATNDPSYKMDQTLKLVLVFIGIVLFAIVCNAIGTIVSELFSQLVIAAKSVAQEAVVSAFRIPPTV